MAERSGYRLLLILGLLLVVLLVIVPLFGMFMWAPMMMGTGMMGVWGYPGGMRWGAMMIGLPVLLLFVVLLIAGAYLLLAPRGQGSDSDTALKILNERYAKGEITTEQYVQMKQQLSKK
jgi:putative membrane protein